MVRATALLALLEAARCGHCHASFHGFRICALRESTMVGSDTTVDVSFFVSHRANSLECGVVSVCVPQDSRHCASAENAQTTGFGKMEPIARATVMTL